MGQDPSTGRAAVTDSQDPEQIQRDIERTREELGDTVEALAEKADVKAQAKQKIDQTKASVAEKKEQLLGKARQASPDSAATAATQASQTARQEPAALGRGGRVRVRLPGRPSNQGLVRGGSEMPARTSENRADVRATAVRQINRQVCAHVRGSACSSERSGSSRQTT